MRYRWIQVLVLWTGFILPGFNLNAQQSDAEHLIGEGDRLAWLKNWQAAEPFFAKAEPLFREARRPAKRTVRPDRPHSGRIAETWPVRDFNLPGFTSG